jgi:hypothetical protein
MIPRDPQSRMPSEAAITAARARLPGVSRIVLLSQWFDRAWPRHNGAWPTVTAEKVDTEFGKFTGKIAPIYARPRVGDRGEAFAPSKHPHEVRRPRSISNMVQS